MKPEDIYKDLHKAMLDDEKYQQILNSIKDENEKKQVSEFVERIMNYFQANVFDPLAEQLENESDFKEAVVKKMEGVIPTNKED